MKCIIDIWGWPCTYNCKFCHKIDIWFNEKTYSKNLNDLKNIQLGIRKVLDKVDITVFNINSWYETTTDKNLIKILSFIQSYWSFDITLSTNWEELKASGQVELLKNKGVTKIYLPIYWTEEVHNKITWNINSWSFFQTAMKNLQECGIEFQLHCIIMKDNIHVLEEVDILYPNIEYLLPFKSNSNFEKNVADIDLIPINIRKKIVNYQIPCYWLGTSDFNDRDYDFRISSDGVSSARRERYKKYTYVPSCNICTKYKNGCTWFNIDYIDLFPKTRVFPIN